MRWDNYLDPGQTGWSQQPSYGEMYPKREVTGDTLQEGWGDIDLSGLLSLFAPETMKGDRPALESAMLDIGQWLGPPAKGAMSAAAIPAMGMVRWGKKEFPNAFLHRRIGDADELDWLSKVFQRGETTQAPSSLVTPSTLQTFSSDPYGIIFNVNDPATIKHAGIGDMYSRKIDRDPPRKLAEMWDRISSKSAEAFNRGWSNEQRYSDAFNKVDTKFRDMHPLGKTWEPTSPNTRFLRDPNKTDLRAFLREQLGYGIDNMEGKAESILWHSEIIPEIDRSMVAGVRLPLKENLRTAKEQALDDLFPLMSEGDAISTKHNPDLIKALMEFAEQMHVPIFWWPEVKTQTQQVRGMMGDPLRGTWYRPEGKDYVTSSMLPEIFGITELP